MRLAQIEDGTVVNVIEVDPEGTPEWASEWPEAGEAGPGWFWDGETFAPPPEPPPPEPPEPGVPLAVPPAALRLVLLGMGLLDAVNEIAASDPAAAIVWEYMTTARRDSPLIAALADNPIRPFTPEEIDAIFMAAGALDY